MLRETLFCLLATACVAFATETRPFVTDWKFVKGDVDPESAQTRWEPVTLPHTWNAVDALDGGGKDQQSRDGYYRGPGWYQKSFRVPENLKGKRLFLRFEGVGSVADVYLNGAHLGQHRGAFGAFCYELTDRLNYGDENELRVRADNSWRKDVPPLSGDFPVFGGIYRPVALLIREPACITPLDHASPGVFITQKAVNSRQASVEVLTKLSNAGAPGDFEVRCVIKDASGGITASNTMRARIETSADVLHQFKLENPHLWNGRKNPYLYSVEVMLVKDGVAIDSSIQPLGLRFFQVDPKLGFFLNGQPYKLYGVNRHQDRAGKGWAVSDADHDEDVSLITEIGARAVRLAHYPQASYFYELCDKAGLLAWAEIPLVDCVTAETSFGENAKEQLVELVRQQYNHPSIFCWSLFNEMYHRDSADAGPLLNKLNAVCKAEDPGRFTAGAVNKRREDLCNVTDLLAFNEYPGWYDGQASQMKGNLDAYNIAGKSRGVGIAEYGAGASIYQHRQNPSKSVPDSRWHPEEWQAIVHEGNYAAIKNADYCWGSFVWNMFDFASVWRNEGDAPGMNDKGLVTYDRKVRKDAFFFYKANWSDEPVLYITSRRHVDREESLTPIKVYSNAREVTLLVNGKQIGTKPVSDLKIVCWEDIQLNEGENVIEIRANIAGHDVTDSCSWKLNRKSVVRKE